ncbi:MAG: pantetheine-phosphate adenylyltransferase [Armatimonadaceae bacterium]|jgi:pantetheine-phosphate adenylyltransferase
MSKQRIAVYPGSFDPVTNGHLDVIRRAAGIFDKVIVGVGRNVGKAPLFTTEERVSLIQVAVSELQNVEVESFDGMLVAFAKQHGASVLVKGLRAISDFEYEFQMALANRHLDPTVETMFLMTSAEYQFLSSSIVKEMVRVGGDCSPLVPSVVMDALRRSFDVNTSQER